MLTFQWRKRKLWSETTSSWQKEPGQCFWGVSSCLIPKGFLWIVQFFEQCRSFCVGRQKMVLEFVLVQGFEAGLTWECDIKESIPSKTLRNFAQSHTTPVWITQEWLHCWRVNLLMKGVPLMKGVLTEVVVLLRQFVREAEVRVRLKKKNRHKTR